MLSSILTTLLTGGLLVSGAAIYRPRSLDNQTNFASDDVIVFGLDGRSEVWTRSEYTNLLEARNAFALTHPTPPVLNTTSPSIKITPRSHIKKRCSEGPFVYENPEQSFLNWDVLMSSVVQGTVGGTSTVTIATGFTLTNSITVSASTQITIIEKVLSATYGISYTESWATSTTASFAFQVPEGKFGAIVSNPLTTRRTGTVLEGCVGEYTDSATYTADSYQDQDFGGLAWVAGTISLCTGDSYPLKGCIGGADLL